MRPRSPAPEARDRQHRPVPEGPLRPFSATLVSGLPFDSGHTVWFLDLYETPTEPEHYREIWIIEPDGTRVLYSGSQAAVESVLRYHAFDETGVGDIDLYTDGVGGLEVRLSGPDRELELSVATTETTATTLLTAATRLTPTVVARSGPGNWLATVLFNRLGGARGTALVGHTETGSPYRFEGRSIRRVGSATGTLDGVDLGSMAERAPAQSFGDIGTPARPLVMEGDIFLPVEEP